MCDKTTTYTFDFALPGLNGSKGLIRSHFSAKKKLKEKIQWLIIEQGVVHHKGKVKVTYRRWSWQEMDDDNFHASSKLAVDALVKCGVIEDDKPKIIAEREWIQERGKPKTEITIASLPETP